MRTEEAVGLQLRTGNRLNGDNGSERQPPVKYLDAIPAPASLKALLSKYPGICHVAPKLRRCLHAL
jgi:hypothetical protein